MFLVFNKQKITQGHLSKVKKEWENQNWPRIVADIHGGCYFLLLHLNYAGLDQIHWSHKILCSTSGMHLYQPENSNSISGSQVENQYRWFAYYFLNTKTEFQITVMLAVLWIRDAQALHLPMEAFPPKGYLIDWKISVFSSVSLIRLIWPSRESVSFDSKIG